MNEECRAQIAFKLLLFRFITRKIKKKFIPSAKVGYLQNIPISHRWLAMLTRRCRLLDFLFVLKNALSALSNAWNMNGKQRMTQKEFRKWFIREIISSWEHWASDDSNSSVQVIESTIDVWPARESRLVGCIE